MRRTKPYCETSWPWLVREFWAHLIGVCIEHQVGPGEMLSARRRRHHCFKITYAKRELARIMRENYLQSKFDKVTRFYSVNDPPFGVRTGPISTPVVAALMGMDHSSIVLMERDRLKVAQ